jgi:hypothetical protein
MTIREYVFPSAPFYYGVNEVAGRKMELDGQFALCPTAVECPAREKGRDSSIYKQN